MTNEKRISTHFIHYLLWCRYPKVELISKWMSWWFKHRIEWTMFWTFLKFGWISSLHIDRLQRNLYNSNSNSTKSLFICSSDGNQLQILSCILDAYQSHKYIVCGICLVKILICLTLDHTRRSKYTNNENKSRIKYKRSIIYGKIDATRMNLFIKFWTSFSICYLFLKCGIAHCNSSLLFLLFLHSIQSLVVTC